MRSMTLFYAILVDTPQAEKYPSMRLQTSNCHSPFTHLSQMGMTMKSLLNKSTCLVHVFTRPCIFSPALRLHNNTYNNNNNNNNTITIANDNAIKINFDSPDSSGLNYTCGPWSCVSVPLRGQRHDCGPRPQLCLGDERLGRSVAINGTCSALHRRSPPPPPPPPPLSGSHPDGWILLLKFQYTSTPKVV